MIEQRGPSLALESVSDLPHRIEAGGQVHQGPMDLVPVYSSYTASGTCLGLSETEGPGA